jgi:hypothetical protein
VNRDVRHPHLRTVRDDQIPIDDELYGERMRWTLRDAAYRLAALAVSVAVLGGTVLVAWALARLIRK